MGNTSSSSKSSLNDSGLISKPSKLGDIHRSSTGRRASTGRNPAPDNNNNLSTPRSHRRNRSANPSVTDLQRHAAPPPSYSEALASPQLSPNANRATSNGSSHTTVITVPPASNRATSSAGNATRRTPMSRNSYLRAPMRQNTTEDALETLRKFDTIIIVDDSGSMQGTLWAEARDALASLADTAAKYDADGIDVHFLNDKSVGTNMTDAASVQRLFGSVRPRGVTPIGEKLEELLLEYVSTLEQAKDTDPALFKSIKPVNYIVLTDGAPTDDPESVIVATAKRLDARNFPITQVGIQFVQIGNSRRATDYLKELDDGLASCHGIRDIVDTTPYTGGRLNAEVLTKILLGGINRRVDRAGAKSVMD